MQERITQTSGANSTCKHNHSEIERFLTLNECKIVKTQMTPSIVIVNKFSDLH